MKSLFAWAFLATSVCAIPQDPKIGNTLLGPIYSPSTNTSLQPWTDAKKNATNLINQILATGNSTYGRLDQNGTSFSAQVFSLYSNKSLFEFHFQAPTMNGSYTKGNLTENTIYRTGSLGKLLTVYNFLVDVGDKVFNDPISKYIVSRCQSITALAGRRPISTARVCQCCEKLHQSSHANQLGRGHGGITRSSVVGYRT